MDLVDDDQNNGSHVVPRLPGAARAVSFLRSGNDYIWAGDGSDIRCDVTSQFNDFYYNDKQN